MYRRVCVGVLLLGVLNAYQARADLVIGYDGFETHTNGDPVVTTDYPLTQDEYSRLTPDVGTAWIRYSVQPNSSSIVTNAVAYSGSQSLSLKRTTATGGLYCGFGTGVPINPNHQYVFSCEYMNANDMYAADNHANMLFCDSLTGTTQRMEGAWSYYANKTAGGPGNFSTTYGVNTQDCLAIYRGTGSGSGTYRYMNGVNDNSHNMEGIGTAGSGIGSLLNPGDWYKMEMVVTIAAPVAGLYSMTYDTYFTNLTAGGSRTLIRASTICQNKLTTASLANGWYVITGANAPVGTNAWSQSYFDNITITEVPEPATMSILGLGVLGLLRKREHV